MQRVLNRTRLAKNQAVRVKRNRDEKLLRKEKAIYRNTLAAVNFQWNHAAHEEKKRRIEDWELGPLAPWRTAPSYADKYGAFASRAYDMPIVPKSLRVKNWFVRTGDRVCVVEGREQVRGKIGKVLRVDEEKEFVCVEGLRFDIMTPAALEDSTAEAIQTTEIPIPLSHVKLVYPLPDPQTGIPRDVILSDLRKRNAHFDIYKNKTVWDRYLHPQNVRIPWPETADTEFIDHKHDTLRIDVEDDTLMPTLLRPPMPPTVINEMRNAYSKFRDRHEEAWLEGKRLEDEEVARKKEFSRRLIPQGARNIARPQWGQTLGWKARGSSRELSDTWADVIGGHMQKKGVTLKSDKLVYRPKLTETSSSSAAHS